MDKKISHYLKNSNFRCKKKTAPHKLDMNTKKCIFNRELQLPAARNELKEFNYEAENNDFDLSDCHSNIITSSTFKKSRGKIHWSKEDDKLFYEALLICGTEFTLISELFPYKTRRQIKMKFLREEKLNKHKIDKTLSLAVNFDREAYNNLKNLQESDKK